MKQIFDTPYFSLVEMDSRYGIHMKTVSVAILPYTVDANGIVEQLGILEEWNELRVGNYAHTLITGTVENKDADVYETAVRELLEEAGIDMSTQDQSWLYLGNFYDSKDTDKCMPTFAVDVTGAKIQPAATDGSPKENASSFSMLDVNEVLTTSSETLPLAAFLRLFNIMYRQSFQKAI